MKVSVTASLLIMLSLWASNSEAACTGSSPTWTSTPDQASVQTCVNSAGIGDTLLISVGSATWTTAVTIPSNKNLVIQGAGIDQTVITVNASLHGMNVGQGNKRITGFTFITPKGSTYGVAIDGDGWRIDNTKFVNLTTGTYAGSIWARGGRQTAPYGPTGLIDHVVFNDTRMAVGAYADQAYPVKPT